MVIGLIIYLVGYVVSYYFSRYIMKRRFGDDMWGWDDIRINLVFSIFSWISVVVVILCCPKADLENIKPPKWL